MRLGHGSAQRLAASTLHPASNAPTAEYTGPLAGATLRLTIPGPTNSAFKRRPAYVSAATKSVLSGSIVASALTAAQISAYNATPSLNHFDTGTLPNATCPASGPDFVCTIAIKLPPGTDNVTIAAYDSAGGSGNVLSQQMQTLSVVAGGSASAANQFSVTLDANAATMTVSGSGSCQKGPIGSSYGSVGTTPVNFTVAYTDPAGKTTVSPVSTQAQRHRDGRDRRNHRVHRQPVRAGVHADAERDGRKRRST